MPDLRLPSLPIVSTRIEGNPKKLE